MRKYYKGKFTPKNWQKYKGNSTNITYRSLWELRAMRKFDANPNILEWNSEELIIPYVSPNDGRVHRYFPDFWVKARDKRGVIKEMIIEVKPKHQTEPPKVNKRVTKKIINEYVTYGVNQAKFKAAKEYCDKRGWEFVVQTEYELGIKK